MKSNSTHFCIVIIGGNDEPTNQKKNWIKMLRCLPAFQYYWIWISGADELIYPFLLPYPPYDDERTFCWKCHSTNKFIIYSIELDSVGCRTDHKIYPNMCRSVGCDAAVVPQLSVVQRKLFRAKYVGIHHTCISRIDWCQANRELSVRTRGMPLPLAKS